MRIRCDICCERLSNPNEFRLRKLCDGCHCEYRAVFDGFMSTRRKKSSIKAVEKEKSKRTPLDSKINDYFNNLLFGDR